MKIRDRLTNLLFLTFILLTIGVTAFADTIRLKDGSIIKGKITGFSGGKFVVEIGEGARKRQLTFDSSEVESIEFDNIASGNAVNRGTESDERLPQATNVVVSQTPPGIPRQLPSTTVVRNEERSAPSTVNSIPSPTENGAAKPIEITIRVLADNTSNGWTNSGWVVKKGQRIRISGTGEISLGSGVSSTAAGLWDREDPNKLLKAVPTGALLAVVGDDNNDFIYIGSEREFVAARDGALFLGINEGNLNDNSGALTVKIEIFPG